MTLLLNSATAYPLMGINKEKDKATHPFPRSRRNASVTRQLLMRPNERISPEPVTEAHTAPIEWWTQPPRPVNALIGY